MFLRGGDFGERVPWVFKNGLVTHKRVGGRGLGSFFFFFPALPQGGGGTLGGHWIWEQDFPRCPMLRYLTLDFPAPLELRESKFVLYKLPNHEYLLIAAQRKTERGIWDKWCVGIKCPCLTLYCLAHEHVYSKCATLMNLKRVNKDIKSCFYHDLIQFTKYTHLVEKLDVSKIAALLHRPKSETDRKQRFS